MNIDFNVQVKHWDDARLEECTFNNEEVTQSVHRLCKLNKYHLGLNSRCSVILLSYWEASFWAGNNQLCLTLNIRGLKLISSSKQMLLVHFWKWVHYRAVLPKLFLQFEYHFNKEMETFFPIYIRRIIFLPIHNHVMYL